jgi:hypothetical protein
MKWVNYTEKETIEVAGVPEGNAKQERRMD